jgi:hypothetical protein
MMNNQSLSWIDRGRWEGLLAKAIEAPAPAICLSPARPSVAPARPPAPAAPVAIPSTAPRSAAPRLPVVPSLPATRPWPVVPARLAGSPPDAPLAPPAQQTSAGYPVFSSSSRSFAERLQALVAWIEDCVPCRAAFIADDNGLPVVEHLGAEPGQIAAASSILLMLASVRSLMQDSGGWLALKIGAAILHVVEVATPWGRFGIGVVTDDCLSREFLAALSTAVEHAFHGESAAGGST